MQLDIGNNSQDEKTNRHYSSPQLTVYGALADLTATGTGSASESNSGSNSGMPCTPIWKAHSSCTG